MANSLRRFLICGSAAAFAALAMSSSAAQPARQQVMVLDGGTLIDGTGRAPITDAVVVVRGNRISAVGSKGQVRIPAGAKIVKTDNRTILPGLIDSHVHTQDYFLPLFLHYGVTSILNKVSHPAWTVAMREGFANGTVKGPRMYWSGVTIDGLVDQPPGGGGTWNTRVTRTPEETASFARTLIADGVDTVNTNQSINEAQLKALIAVQKETGVPMMGHVKNMRRAAELGWKYQEHFFGMGASLLDPEDKSDIGLARSISPEGLADPARIPSLVDFMVKQGVYVNPTLVSQWTAGSKRAKQLVDEEEGLLKDPGLAFVPAGVKALWHDVPGPYRDGYPIIAEFLRQYTAAGGKIVNGTDASYHLLAGLSVHYEMQMLVDAGVSPMRAIQSTTLWNAEVMNQQKDIGSIEPGKLADFTIIEGDPLTDISATKNIRMVIQDGKVIDTKYDPNYVNPVPAPFEQQNIGLPTITSATPAIVRQGGNTVTLEIDGIKYTPERLLNYGTGASFAPNSIVRFDNVDLPTKFVSPTKLTATLDAKLLQRAPGFYPLYVVTPGLHGNVSPAAYEVVDTADAPVEALPVPYNAYAAAGGRLYGPVPRMAPQGGQTVEITIDGTRMSRNSIVRLDNVDLPTKFVSNTRLTATVDAKLLQRPPGNYVLYVLTPGLYGTVSRAAYFQVGMKNSKMIWTEPLQPK